jgi:hypothetical protein
MARARGQPRAREEMAVLHNVRGRQNTVFGINRELLRSPAMVVKTWFK